MQDSEHTAMCPSEEILAGIIVRLATDEEPHKLKMMLDGIDTLPVQNLALLAIRSTSQAILADSLPVDFPNLIAYGKNHGLTAQHLIAFQEAHLSAVSAEIHLKKVRDHHRLLTIKDRAKQVLESDSIGELLDGLADLAKDRTPQESEKPADLKGEIKRKILNPDKRYVTTGMPRLDEFLGGGLRRGQLVTLAGRSGMGKTAFATSMIAHRLRKRIPTVLVTMEMGSDEVLPRCVATLQGIPTWQFNDTSRWGADRVAQVSQMIDTISDLGTVIFDQEKWFLTDLCRVLRNLKADYDRRKEPFPDTIIVDYLQQVQSSLKDSPRHLQVGEVTRELKILARELDVALIAVAQLSRATETRSDPVPMLSDLRESGSIEQDSNKVLFCYRPSKYSADRAAENQPNQEAYIVVGKNREGRAGLCPMIFDPETTTWKE